MLRFDDEHSRHVEATYTTPDVVEQRRAVRELLAVQPGERVLDVGCGPGLLAVELALDAGPDGAVHGLDPSESMLALARARDRPAGAAPVTFGTGDALALPVGDASFDAVVATQVYEYVEDVGGALCEARRILRPGGRLLVLDTDWDSLVWRSSDPGRMGRILRVWDRHLADPYLPRRLPGLLRAAGLELQETAVVPLLNVGFDPSTFSAYVIETIAGFVRQHGAIDPAEVDAWAGDLRTLGDEAFFSLNRYVFVASSAGSPNEPNSAGPTNPTTPEIAPW